MGGVKPSWSEWDKAAMKYNIVGYPDAIRTGKVTPEDYVNHYVSKAFSKYGDANATYAMTHGLTVNVGDGGQWAMQPLDDSILKSKFGVSAAEVGRKENMFRKIERDTGRSHVGATFGGQLSEQDYRTYDLALARLGYKTERDGNSLVVTGRWRE